MIDGVIEVETTAESRPPLKIPVSRYALPSAHTGGPGARDARRSDDQRGS
jgi:hypothetical protein